MKTKLVTQERINALLAALILIGLALVLVGAWRFVDASQQLTGNVAHQVQQGDAAFDIQTPEQAQGLIASDLQKRRLEHQQSESMVMAGVGLGALAISWLAYDVIRGRRRAKPQPESTPTEQGAQ